MNKRKTILSLVLVLQVGLIAFLYRPGSDISPPAVNLFENMEPDQVTGLTITDDEGKVITLTKNDGSWQVGQEQYPGDDQSIAKILKKIASLQSSRLVTRTKASHSRLKVGDQMFNRKVVVAGSETGTFYIGTAPNTKAVHLRRSGENQVYQVAGLSSWELQADKDSWWQSKYVKSDLNDIREVELDNASGSFVLLRAEDSKWQLKEALAVQQLDQKKVDDLVSSISSLSVFEYLDKSYKTSGEPVAKVSCRTKDSSFSLQIWPNEDENGEHVVKNSQVDFFAKIKAYTLKDLLEAKAKDLIGEETGEAQRTEGTKGLRTEVKALRGEVKTL